MEKISRTHFIELAGALGTNGKSRKNQRRPKNVVLFSFHHVPIIMNKVNDTFPEMFPIRISPGRSIPLTLLVAPSAAQYKSLAMGRIKTMYITFYTLFAIRFSRI